MKYGMTFILDVYDFGNEEEKHVLTTPGDYIRTQEWLTANMPPAEGEGAELVRDIRVNYATMYHALKRRGKLGEYGLPEELTVAAIDEMADRFSVYVNAVGEDELPLKGQRKK